MTFYTTDGFWNCYSETILKTDWTVTFFKKNLHNISWKNIWLSLYITIILRNVDNVAIGALMTLDCLQWNPCRHGTTLVKVWPTYILGRKQNWVRRWNAYLDVQWCTVNNIYFLIMECDVYNFALLWFTI